MLLANSEENTISMQQREAYTQPISYDSPVDNLVQARPYTHDMETIIEKLTVNLSAEDLQRIYHPWKYSLIIKLMGKRIPHHYLKRKIQELGNLLKISHSWILEQSIT